MIELSQSIDQNDLTSVELKRLQAFELLASYYNSAADSIDLSASSDLLADQIREFSLSDQFHFEQIYAEQGGYFISYTDGFENRINKEALLELSIGEILALVEDTEYRINNNACKVVSDYIWYFAAIVDDRDAERFFVGQSLSLDLDRGKFLDLPVQVLKILTDEECQEAVILFSCENLNADITGFRVEGGNISFRNYKGIRVPRSALRVIDGEAGVFIRYDNKVRFKRVKILYETEDYILVSPSRDSTMLSLYDEVIIEGKDLYIGKSLL